MPQGETREVQTPGSISTMCLFKFAAIVASCNCFATGWSTAASRLCARDATVRRRSDGAAQVVGSNCAGEVWSLDLLELLAACRFARLWLANLLCASLHPSTTPRARRNDGTVAAVARHVGPSMERVSRDAGVATSSTGSVAATESSDGEAILSTFTAVFLCYSCR